MSELMEERESERFDANVKRIKELERMNEEQRKYFDAWVVAKNRIEELEKREKIDAEIIQVMARKIHSLKQDLSWALEKVIQSNDSLYGLKTTTMLASEMKIKHELGEKEKKA